MNNTLQLIISAALFAIGCFIMWLDPTPAMSASELDLYDLFGVVVMINGLCFMVTYGYIKKLFSK